MFPPNGVLTVVGVTDNIIMKSRCLKILFCLHEDFIYCPRLGRRLLLR